MALKFHTSVAKGSEKTSESFWVKFLLSTFVGVTEEQKTGRGALYSPPLQPS